MNSEEIKGAENRGGGEGRRWKDERMVQKGAKCLKLGYVQLYNESSVSGKHTMP